MRHQNIGSSLDGALWNGFGFIWIPCYGPLDKDSSCSVPVPKLLHQPPFLLQYRTVQYTVQSMFLTTEGSTCMSWNSEEAMSFEIAERVVDFAWRLRSKLPSRGYDGSTTAHSCSSAIFAIFGNLFHSLSLWRATLKTLLYSTVQYLNRRKRFQSKSNFYRDQCRGSTVWHWLVSAAPDVSGRGVYSNLMEEAFDLVTEGY